MEKYISGNFFFEENKYINPVKKTEIFDKYFKRNYNI